MSCSQNLANVAKACNRSTSKGLVPAIYIAADDEVASIGAATAHVVSTITMEATETFYEIFIDSVGGSFKTETIGEGESKEYQHTLTVFIPGMDNTVTNTLNNAIRGRFIVVFTDKNGKKRILGAVDDGASLSVGEQTDDKNGYPLVFTWTSPNLLYYTTATLTVAA